MVLLSRSWSPRGDTIAFRDAVSGRECGEEMPWHLPSFSLPFSLWLPTGWTHMEATWLRSLDSTTLSEQLLNNAREGQEKDPRALCHKHMTYITTGTLLRLSQILLVKHNLSWWLLTWNTISKSFLTSISGSHCLFLERLFLFIVLTVL